MPEFFLQVRIRYRLVTDHPRKLHQYNYQKENLPSINERYNLPTETTISINKGLFDLINSLKNDLKQGESKFWYPDGVVKEIAKYDKDSLIEYICFYQNGNTKRSYSIDKRSQIAFVKIYHDDGNLSSEGKVILTGNGADYEKTSEWNEYPKLEN